jgi:peptidoglycan/xylan/chitin deacetylase (PgdA/CDA1 family)
MVLSIALSLFAGSTLAWLFSAMAPRKALFDLFFDTIWAGNSRIPSVAITFDDGPSPIYTPRISTILRSCGVRGTFFLTGKNVDRYPQIAAALHEEGHMIGNHSYSHAILPLLPDAEIEREIVLADEAIERATGCRPYLVRPPYGYRSPRVLRKLQNMGKRVVFWTTMSWDWANPSAGAIVSRTLANVKNGSIILFHDGEGKYLETHSTLVDVVGRYIFGAKDRDQTIKALPFIIIHLLNEGYRLVTVGDLVAQFGGQERYLCL